MSLESKLLHPRYHPGYHPRIPAQPMSLSRLGPSSGRPRPREEWGLQVVLAGGAEGSFLCSLSSRFSGRGGGVGSLPRAWRRVGVPGAAGAKKNCEIGVGFSFAALSVFRLRRAEAASALWIPHSLGAFRIARGAGGEAVREREPRRAGEGR